MSTLFSRIDNLKPFGKLGIAIYAALFFLVGTWDAIFHPWETIKQWWKFLLEMLGISEPPR